MSEKPKKPDKEKPQIERFKEAARAIEADESRDALERAFSKITPAQPKKAHS